MLAEGAEAGGGSMKAGDVFPDLHHKMSKKIAQLTKVIYHLNTKNEDRQYELEEVNTNHQKEMQDILSDAANKIKRFKEQLASKQGQLNTEAQVVEKLRQTHAKEKKEALAEFRSFKRTAKAREESIQIECNERTSELSALVEKEKKAFEESLRRFQEKGSALKAALESAKKSAAQNVSTLKGKHQVELEEAVRKGNEKFNTMITEQLMAQDEIRRAAEAEVKEEKRASEQGLGRLRAELAGDKEAALSALRRESDEELQTTRKSFTEKVERALLDAARSRTACIEEKKRNISLKDELERLSGEVFKLRENAAAMLETSRLEEASLRRLLENASAEGRRLVKALEHAEAARDEAQAAGRGAGGEAEGLRDRLRKEKGEKEAFERGAAAEIASKDGEIASRLGEIASLRQKLDGAIVDGKRAAQKLEKELAEAREMGRKASNRADATAESLRVSRAEAERAVGEGKNGVADLQRQLELQKQQAAAAQASLRASLERELQDSRQAASEAKVRADKDLEESRQAAAGGTKELTERAKRREEELMRQLGEETRRYEAVLEAERSSRAAEKEQASAALDALRLEAARDVERLQRAVEEGGQEADQEKSRLRAEVSAFRKELDEKSKAFDLEKDKAEQSIAEVGRLTRELDLARAEQLDASKAAVATIDEERAVAQAEARALEDRAMRETQERLRRAAADAEGAQAAEVERVSEELRLKYDADLQSAVRAERDEAETRHEEVLRQMKAWTALLVVPAINPCLSTSQENERRALIAAHKKRVKEAEANGRAAASSMRVSERGKKKQAEEKKTLKEQFRSELREQASRSARELEKALAAALREGEAAVAAAVSAKTLQFKTAKAIGDKATAALTTRLQGERDAEHAALEKIKEELKQTNDLLERVRQDTAAAKEETEAVKRAGEAEARSQRSATAAREAALVSKHATELSHAVGRQRDELREAQNRFGDKERDLSNRIDALQQEQRRLEHRYENRPSREEDVRRIRKLEANAIESRNAEVRAREEMAFFKRELLNREENYNKKFNANPVVGVMQVVKPKDIRGASEGSRRTSAENGRSSKAAHQQQPRPPRYNAKTSRSASMPSGYPTSGAG
ncbi:unnamed protein product, partial [Scytosiphon promiscuus]